MDKVRVYFDRDGRTLTVWFGDPATEEVCEEADDDTILMKDSQGRIIGFEKLNIALAPGSHGLAVEMMNLSSDAA